MAKGMLSTKRLQIDKSNSQLTLIVAVAVFVVIFSLVISKGLLDQRAYQSRVIQSKEAARDQLEENIQAVDELKIAYENFVTRQENIIGGVIGGATDRDGDNAKIVLDALPSKYDFPALATSLEKLINQNNSTIVAIAGDDDEVERASSEAEASPAPYEMPFMVRVRGPYDASYGLMRSFERSIRPMQIEKVVFTADNDGLVETQVTAKTYYMPQKALTIKKEVVK